MGLDVNGKTMKYFLAMWPILMSLGMGGSIVGCIYGLYVYVWKKIMERWMCSLNLTDRDPTFQWVRKYMKDEGLIQEEGTLKVNKKRPEENYWTERNNDKRKPEVEYNTGCGQHLIYFKGRRVWIDHYEGKT